MNRTRLAALQDSVENLNIRTGLPRYRVEHQMLWLHDERGTNGCALGRNIKPKQITIGVTVGRVPGNYR